MTFTNIRVYFISKHINNPHLRQPFPSTTTPNKALHLASRILDYTKGEELFKTKDCITRHIRHKYDVTTRGISENCVHQKMGLPLTIVLIWSKIKPPDPGHTLQELLKEIAVKMPGHPRVERKPPGRLGLKEE